MRPILFNIGSFPVHTFGVMLTLAFFAAIALLRHRAAKFGTTKEAITDVAFWTIIAGILGARVLFIAQEWPHYAAHLNELFSIQFQGLTSFGGLIAGGIAAVVVGKKKGIPPATLLDLVAPAFLVGHAIGRIGCLFNGCCVGGQCDPNAWYAVMGADDGYYHFPAQVVDSLMNFAALGAVLGIERRGLRPLATTGLVLILHGLARFVYEFFRAGASSTVWFHVGPIPMTEAHVMALAVSLFGAGLIAYGARRSGTVRGVETPA